MQTPTQTVEATHDALASQAEPLPGSSNARTPYVVIPAKEMIEATERIAMITSNLLWNEKSVGLGMVWARDVKPKVRWTRDLPTWAIGAGGVFANPDFTKELSNEQLSFVMCHETLHFALNHTSQAVQLGLAEPGTWRVLDKEGSALLGIAQDMVINKLLVRDGYGNGTASMITQAKVEAIVGEPWTGALDSIEIFYWLKKKQQQQQAGQPQAGQGQGQPQPQAQPQQGKPGPKGQGKPQKGASAGQGVKGLLEKYGAGDVGAGCSPLPETGEAFTQQDVEAMRATLREHTRGTGSALAEALQPKPGRISYRDVLKVAASTAQTESTSRVQTPYSRAGRRDYGGGIIMPGRTGTSPRLGVIIDVSGSIDRDTLSRILGETLKLQADFPTSKVYLVTHTDVVCWEGWLRAGGDKAKIIEATKHTGGTRAEPAYSAMRALGRFDAVVHFTDTYIENPWPDPPCQSHRFAVGIVGERGGELEDVRKEAPHGCKLLAVREG